MADQEDELRDTVMRALRHPLRRKIVGVLLEQDPNAMGPRDTATLLSQPLSNVAYHFTILAKANLAECVHTEQVWGRRPISIG